MIGGAHWTHRTPGDEDLRSRERPSASPYTRWVDHYGKGRRRTQRMWIVPTFSLPGVEAGKMT
jgi:hypothetical protein